MNTAISIVFALRININLRQDFLRMAGLTTISSSALYNLLNQSSIYSSLSDLNHVLLLDARQRNEYDESHILTARKVHKNSNGKFCVPHDAELECKQHVVVYDGKTCETTEDSEAVVCAKIMSDHGSRNRVEILKGGYEEFSAYYPFLRTQKIMFMPRELDALKPYPKEILLGCLYMGNKEQATQEYIKKDLKIKAFVSCSMDVLKPNATDWYNLECEDDDETDITGLLKDVCAFIDGHREQKNVVLVFSDQGIGRAAVIALAYLIFHKRMTLEEAWKHTISACPRMRPRRNFVRQLSKFEEEVHGSVCTDISDPGY